MRKLPPLGSLRAFEAAARHMSFREAANELGVTPTAISHQIRILEDICGQPLFRRRPRPLELTSAGERLFPVIRSGFDMFASAIAAASPRVSHKRLRVTSPNAFASRWLVPRLPKWRDAYPKIPLEIIGTDSVLDLRAGEAAIAIRYARRMPLDLTGKEIFRDTFFPVCSPELLARGTQRIKRAADLLHYPLIHFDWMNQDRDAPTWSRWLATARSIDPSIPETNKAWDLSFREELHAIDAVAAGQGIAMLSDVVVSRELKSGVFVKAHDLSLPGYGFYVVHVPNHPEQPSIGAFSAWLRLVT
jgi:LysR family transcriptional regulator, glycine cleavage system transcriptional activator